MKKIKEFFMNQRAMFDGWRFSIKAMTTHHLCAKIFYGWQHYKYAKKYAERRNNIDRKAYYVLPFGDETLLVANRIELQALKDKGVVKKDLNHKDFLEQAYYRVVSNGVKKEF